MKLDRPARAEDLYRSPWFVKARAYVKSLGASWRILSAKHGLVDPGDVIEPYELTLNEVPAAERRSWAGRVLESLTRLVGRGDKVVLLAGERYRQFLFPGLRDMGVHVEVPMHGLGIGEQLRWLDRHTS